MSEGRRIGQPGEVFGKNRRKRQRRYDRRNPYWQPLIAHINETWKAKKGNAAFNEPEYNYPFTGRDFKILKHWASLYLETGLMALWDSFLERSDDFTIRTGYSIQEFQRQLPRLVDDYAWKKRREFYDAKFPADIPHEIDELFETKPAQVITPPKKLSHNQKWALAHPDDPRAKKYLLHE